ncbi:MAG: hypothetical protein EA362_09435 [Saprospirales bacterium]|nr:MAG: hypothetical protein EA362_09435 [Saprospirales bacterium]
MIKILVSLVLIFSFLGCRNYDSQRYIDNENHALESILHQMIDYQSMVQHNKMDTTNVKIFLFSTLDTIVCEFYRPGFSFNENGDLYPIVLSREKQKEYKAELEQYELDKKLFSPFINGKIKSRELDHKFEYSNLEVVLFSENLLSLNLKPNELGYMYVSRIVFDRNFKKGYLSFSFFCGQACLWRYNIEIHKINGKWEISRYFSGGIA